MKEIKPFDYSYETSDGLARTHCYGTDETWVRLDPDERVINIERVRKIYDYISDCGIDNSKWEELGKELGLE